MTDIALWAGMFPTTATYQNVTSRDIYGAKSVGSAVTFKCHLKTQRVEDFQGDGDVVSLAGTAIMDGVYDVQKGALLTLPSGDTPKITKVDTFYDEVGAHHTTIEFAG